METAVDAELEEALLDLERAAGRLQEVGLAPANSRDAAKLMRRVERVGTRMNASKTELLSNVDDDMLYANDGFFSAKVMLRHTTKISGAEAAGRAAEAKALKELHLVRDAYRSGDITQDKVRRIARVYANTRVREQLIRDEGEFVRLAKRRSYREFDAEVADWVRLVDEDGTADQSEANHLNRDVRTVQEYNGGFQLTGRFGSLQGAQVEEILQHFYEAEAEADFEEARSRLGSEATITKDDLCRTGAQRRADAFSKALLAGATNPAGGGKAEFVTTLVLDAETAERWIEKYSGVDVPDADPWRPNFQSRTIDGRLIDAAEATAAMLKFGFRRAVIDARGVTIDLSRKRLFTGASRLGVQIMNCTCGFAGCETPMSRCEIDHLIEWAKRPDGRGGGLTNPGNGAGMCAKHNRFKYMSGYTTYRDSEGRWRTVRPDGSEV